MAWIKLDDRFLLNPKVANVGKDAKLLYIAALCYAGGELTDGFIPARVLPMLAAMVEVGQANQAIAELTEARLWEQVEKGYQIHDYLDYNPSRTEVLETREARAAAGRRGGLAKSRRAAEEPGKEEASKDEAKPLANAKQVLDVCQVHFSSKTLPRTRTRTRTRTPIDPVNGPINDSNQITNKNTISPQPPDGGGVRPYDVFALLCEETGTDPSTVPKVAKNTALRYCKEMLEAGHSGERIVKCYRYLSKQKWRDSPVEPVTIAKKIAGWVAMGEPDEPTEANGKPNSKEAERDHGDYAAHIRKFG